MISGVSSGMSGVIDLCRYHPYRPDDVVCKLDPTGEMERRVVRTLMAKHETGTFAPTILAVETMSDSFPRPSAVSFPCRAPIASIQPKTAGSSLSSA